MSYLAPRYWVAPDQPVTLADGGFLPDPEHDVAAAFNPAVTSFEAISGIDCLILLGEPGLGKTTALRAEHGVAAAQAEGPDLVRLFDLGATGLEDELRERLFGDASFSSWLSGSAVLHLFLDSLDEARIRIETVADLICDGLDGADFGRLRLRLTCRSADRHYRLEQFLADRFGEDRFAVRELVPLRRVDVAATAQAAGLDPTPFVADIVARELQPLAIRPLTLRFLVDAARSGGALPATATELYDRGCRLLVREPDEDRRRMGTLDVNERLATATRIAAATILTGRSVVLLDEATIASRDEAEVAQFVGGRELTEYGDTFAVSEATVRETCGTGLFSSRGDGRVGWAHQTLGEFLAAKYLARMRTEQVFDLLTFADITGRKTIPQLREVAGWLSTLSPPLFSELLPSDPGVLLRADVALLDEEQRSALVDALLRGVVTGDVDRWDLRIRSNLARLDHRGLADQVVRVLSDPGVSVRSREMAAVLAGACHVEAALDLLTNIALDAGAPMLLRETAVAALRDGWRGRAVLEQIVPLALDPQETDLEDELKGAALQAVWPAIVSADELFAALTPPKRESLLGLYASFLHNDVIDGLRAEDLPAALHWASDALRGHQPTGPLSSRPAGPVARLIQQVLTLAWEHREDEAVLTGIADVVAATLQHGEAHFDFQLDLGDAIADESGRRMLVAALVPAIARGELEAVHVAYARPPLLYGEDVPWLVERLGQAVGTSHEEVWAQLILGTLSRTPHVDLIMEARETSATLRQVTRHWFDPVELASSDAQHARDRWHQDREFEREHAREPTEVPDMAARVRTDLERFEAGEIDAFWHLNLDLSVEQGTRRYTGHFLSDLTEFPGWVVADDATRSRIIDAAERYLVTADPEPDRWFATTTVFQPACAGYRALVLLERLAPGRLDALGREPWQRWASIVIAWRGNNADERSTYVDRVARCFAAAGEHATELFLRFLDASIRESGIAWGIARVRLVDLAHIEEGLLERVQDESLATGARTEILRFLIQRGSAVARAVADQFLEPAQLDVDARQRGLAVEVARVLLDDAGDAGWSSVWPLFNADSAFGRSVVEAVAHLRQNTVADRLEENQLAELFTWLEREFPHAEDPPLPDGVFTPSARMDVGSWRDQTLRGLAAKGTPEALQLLDQLRTAFHDLPEIAFLRRDAQELIHRGQWTPPNPEDVVHLGADRARRWVTSDAELREVLVESLQRAQDELQAATPAAADLWDTTARRPKSEGELSDWLKRWLDQDLRGRGVITGREVQIRPAPRGGLGERGDLVVEAVAGERVDGADIVRVTVEVKGCWNADLDTAMVTQLVERYLLPERERQGIYVVGWFAADDWDDTDRRCRACARRSLSVSREQFEREAVQVSAARDVDITAVTLDCSLPPRAGPARRE